MIKIIFIKNINKNNIGDIIKTKRGYAINYLIPFGYAILANNSNIKNIEKYINNINYIKDKEYKILEKIKNNILKYINNNNEIFIYKKSYNNKLINYIIEKDIIYIIKNNIDKNINIDVKNIIIKNKPIKNIGNHDVYIKINNEIIKITINILDIKYKNDIINK